MIDGQPFRAVLAFDQALLAPDDPNRPGTVAGGRRSVTIDGVWDGAGDLLGTIPMRALLGDAEVTSVDVIDFDWLDDTKRALGIETERRSGTFRLIGICREGSTRLYDVHGVESALKIAPNPAGSRAELEYDLAEDGEIAIDLYDAIGGRVASVVGGYRDAGTYRIGIATGGLPAGVYIAVMRTPTRIVSARIDIRN
jgi:hypothetical protein